MDMDAMVTDSHQLMMSEEQRHHLFKVRQALMSEMSSSLRTVTSLFCSADVSHLLKDKYQPSKLAPVLLNWLQVPRNFTGEVFVVCPQSMFTFIPYLKVHLWSKKSKKSRSQKSKPGRQAGRAERQESRGQAGAHAGKVRQALQKAGKLSSKHSGRE